jgi:molybdate transport system ATP-binding protein
MRMEVSIQKQLKNFTLDIQFTTEIGCLGIIGSYGCGKSMTLKSIAGIVRPDQGEIKLITGEEKGQKTNCFYDSQQKINLASQKRQVGYLFQNYALLLNSNLIDGYFSTLFDGRNGQIFHNI